MAFPCLQSLAKPVVKQIPRQIVGATDVSYTWSLALQQLSIMFLIVGRWLLPKGRLTREKLADILIGYVGMAADILDFYYEGVKREQIRCNETLLLIIMILWSISLLQFALQPPNHISPSGSSNKSCLQKLERSRDPDVAQILVTGFMQDGPFLATRIYLMVRYSILDQSLIFFTFKNTLILMLQVYRLSFLVYLSWKEGDQEDDDENIERRNPAYDSDVPCKNCTKVYIGETGRAFGTRLSEHKKEAEKIGEKQFTRVARKESVNEEHHKSAITDHVAQQNHVIDWENAKVIDKDSNKQTRWIREAIWIHKQGEDVINRDEGTYSLHHVYDQLLKHQPRQHRKVKTGNSNSGGAAAESAQN